MDEFLCSLCGGWDDDLQNGICEFCTSDGKDDRMNKHECVTWEFVDCDEHHEHDDDCRNLRVCVECGADEDDAVTQACNIELAPRRSVVKVETYDIGKDDMMSEHEMTCEWVDWDNPEVCGCIDCCAVCGGNQ